MSVHSQEPLPLETTIITDEFSIRPSRPLNYQALNTALVQLAQKMAEAPRDVLQELVNVVLRFCRAQSAGISLAEDENGQRVFRWHAVAGRYAPHLWGAAPWEYEPCGTGLDQGDILLISNLDQYSQYFSQGEPNVIEALLAPFSIGGETAGAIWVFLHDREGQFDSEDAQVLRMLREFAAAATQVRFMSVLQDTQATDNQNLLRGNQELRKQMMEREQMEADAFRLAAIVESSDDAIVSKDLNGIIRSWNRGAERLFGYQAAEVIGKPISMLVVPERVNEIPEILRTIRNGEHVHHYETLRRRKDGQVINVSLTISPIRNAAGQVIGASKSARDITEQKRAEEERALLLAREQEARKTAELINRVARQLGVELKTERLIQVVTDVAATLVGAEYGVFLRRGEPMENFNIDLKDRGVVRCDDATQTDDRLSMHGLLEGIRSYLVVPVISRSDEVLAHLFLGHSSVNKFNDDHQAILEGIAAQAAIAMDNARLFEQAQSIQTELKRSNAELRHANQSLETFAYSASHDLQEPLRTIALSAQLLERRCKPQLKEEAAGFLASILGGANRMKALIDDLLVYVKAAESEEGPPPQVDSGEIFLRVLKDLSAQIEEVRGVVTHDHLPVVPMHASRLAQIFQNLISNAMKYRNQASPLVHVSAQERDGCFVFSVTDNGIGIEQEYAHQIFEPFRRLHNREQYSGSGIGLGLCQRIMEQYGGRIWLDRSIPGSGSTFCFSIPTQ